MQTTGLAEIITLIEKLSPEEKCQLIEYVARDLQRLPSASVRLSWQDARGLGKASRQGWMLINTLTR